ncbi:MAG: hypothetical protein M3N18_01285 [Actinomycetota bacterium]|nr:hypothetical protein [Actinomycetota bacterium]
MRKLIMLAVVLALVLAAAIPALAQVEFATENESESEEFAAEFAVENTGDYASQCTPVLQFGNTGNFNNAPGFLQYASPEGGDFEPGGIEFSIEPEMEVGCESTVQQSSAASG